uniref:TIR domain-containing protein n=1 Tax=Chrysotila carterae TaxID=13221 RepID=A0A7S4BKT0_CHRCT
MASRGTASKGNFLRPHRPGNLGYKSLSAECRTRTGLSAWNRVSLLFRAAGAFLAVGRHRRIMGKQQAGDSDSSPGSESRSRRRGLNSQGTWRKVRSLLSVIAGLEMETRGSEEHALAMLRDASMRSHKLRWRVSMSIFVITSAVIAAGMVLTVLELVGTLSNEELVALPYMLMPSVALLAVMPTDKNMIGPAALAVLFVTSFFVVTCALCVIYVSADGFQSLLFLLLGLISLGSSLSLLPVYVLRDAHGARWTLRRIWLATRASQIGAAVVYVAWGVARALVCDARLFGEQQQSLARGFSAFRADDIALCPKHGHLVGGLLAALLPAACLALATLSSGPAMRNRFHSHLARLARMGETEVAATIAAALVAPRSSEETLALAKRQFRSLPLRELKPNDLDSNEDTGMHGRTHPALLGTVDAFVSHSWRDAGAHKYVQLTQWGVAFEERHGRQPNLWLDKACIDQGNVADNLAALPVFLSGCREMIILLGPSYMTRLWCVMEMFVFLKMGGQADRVTVLLVGDDSAAPLDNALLAALATRLKHSFQDFDVRTAQCAAAADQERLLAVIESSFIDLRSFNSSVQILFGRILRESIAPWQAGSPFSRSNLTSRQSSQSESESTKDDYFVSIACDMPLQFESTRRMLR